MAADDTQPITFVVPGVSGAPISGGAPTRGATPAAPLQQPPPRLPGKVKASVRVAALRAAGTPVRVTATPGEDIVALHLEDGPVLLLHPATARDLLNGPAGAVRGSGDVGVQVDLAWPGLDTAATGAANGTPGSTANGTRGLADVGRIVIAGFQVLTGLNKDAAVTLAASQVVQAVDGQVDAGVYLLRPDRLDALKGNRGKLLQVPPSRDPMLVLVHGTFVDTASTFGKLWLAPRSGVERLFAHYKGAVYALDHPTLGASPIANARTLVDALPAGARLHLLTHSRGGLVAEVLARVAGQRGATAADLDHFAAAPYASQQDELRALGDLVRAKGIQVERTVRVACPARGTLLASGRLDAYLSVLQWTLRAAGLEVAPAFVDFIGEVARRRADPAEIPGLAAMIPGTPLVNWLNDAPAAVPGDLRVIAGDLQHGSTLTSWLKALLADAYYWTDNDIVVHTRSMYGGAPRAGGASFLLDQSPDATHFTYFANGKTADAAVAALVETQAPADFRPIGPLSWAGTSADGVRGAVQQGAAQQDVVQRSAPDPGKPAVFILPGILGSNLKQGNAPDDARIWLSPLLIGGFGRLAYQPGGADAVGEDGPIGLVYDKLAAHLAASHEVIPFGFDWRRPLQEEAQRLAGRITEALDARQASRQPVRLLAHSMGGLLARTLQLQAPAVWARLMAHADARLLMLGTPNAGSWAPMQVLSGDDTFGNALTAIGSPFGSHQARSLMAQMPGFLQLQAGLLDSALGLASSATWQQLADDDYQREQRKNWWQRYAGDMVSAAYQWGVPPQAVLDQAVALRRALDAQLGGVLQADAGKLRLVVGRARFTPDGFDPGNGNGSGSGSDGADSGFVYLDAQDGGDGRVTLASALLPGVAAWSLDCAHGALPSTTAAFDAYVELLTLGTTSKLPSLAALRSGAATPPPHVRSRPSRQPPAPLPAGSIGQIFGAEPGDLGGAGLLPDAPALQITVLNGNLSFVQQALMLGHYSALQLTGTEKIVDRHLDGAMGTALRTGLYPDQPGEQRVFFNTRQNDDNPWQLPRPRAAIVVGLGAEGMLTATRLALTVCQGAKAWAQRAAEEAAGGAHAVGGIELAATLIGSGGIGISPGESARAIARGVLDANRRLAGGPWPQITRLTLVEWYLDRAGEAWRGVRVLAQANPRGFELAPVIATGTGPLRRQTESGYRGTDYDLINASTAGDGVIAFALDTRRARTEVRAQRTQPKLLRKLIERAAKAEASDPQLGRTLFQLLVPMELKPFLSGTDRLLLQLDSGTAPIPWELLDSDDDDGGSAPGAAADGNGNGNGSGSGQPWSIRTKLLRKLSTTDFRAAPRDATADAAVLVIGEPLIDAAAPGEPVYPPLPGARREAEAVVQQFTGPDGIGESRVTACIGLSFDVVISALMARPYRIVHIAGHGAAAMVDPLNPNVLLSSGGVVLSEGVFLGPDELQKLAVVPELVFVNCCHLGQHAAGQTLTGSLPGRLQIDAPVNFAAAVADALINIGVRCVVAAGWAVEDGPAEAFAQMFYRTLLLRRPFVEAVAAARLAARNLSPGGKTWAAYQCYGDPDWVFTSNAPDAQQQTPAHDEFEVIASAAGLALALENLAVRTAYFTATDPAEMQRQRQATRDTLDRLQAEYGPHWGSMGAVAEAFAVAWAAADDTDQAMGWYTSAVQAADASASLRAHEQLGDLRVHVAWRRVAAAADADGHGRVGADTLAQARSDIEAGLASLQALTAMQPTVERLALCASASQRLGQLLALQDDASASQAALQVARAACAAAEALAASTGDPDLFDPGLDRMALDLVLGEASDPASNDAVRQSLLVRHALQPDFRTNVGLIEFDLYQVLAAGALDAQVARLRAACAELHQRLQLRSAWQKVAEQTRFVMAALLAAEAGAAGTGPATQLQQDLQRYADAV